MLHVWYLCHSGFAVETDRHFLVFDYWKDTPQGGSLATGTVNPGDLAGTGKRVVVFVSHRHPDHFNPVIFDWKRQNPQIELILSDDIPLPGDIEAHMMSPDRIERIAGLNVQTLSSNDEGVAFVVEDAKKRIFHAGDLNWWHWESEPDAWNDEMKRLYIDEISRLEGLSIDLAFFPADPRLGRMALAGLDYLMRNVTVKSVIPMHFWQGERVVETLVEGPACKDYRDRIRLLTARGQHISL
ncbi:MAG: MBL fold metallo-hydrolase [Oscillospiraceae bacterium]|jgi:L-ascorbate metabolism protein UlaG (beta-lactamase superfamily)|nr:MBL fold metallo-hydrolase [Oscillospiraceae bacterium]